MTTLNKDPLKIVFWGTDEFSVKVLATLKDLGILPILIVATPDQPKGRKLIITPPPVKIWGQNNNLPVTQPAKLAKDFLTADSSPLLTEQFDIFLVASYGKIIPEYILHLPRMEAINIHPSLLPKYRGPTPIQSTILADDKETGVSLMVVDPEMDHGPIITQEKIDLDDQISYPTLRDKLAILGARLFLANLEKWSNGNIETKAQDHTKATYTKKIIKDDGLIDLKDSPSEIYRKFRAYTPWPGFYFFTVPTNKTGRV